MHDPFAVIAAVPTAFVGADLKSLFRRAALIDNHRPGSGGDQWLVVGEACPAPCLKTADAVRRIGDRNPTSACQPGTRDEIDQADQGLQRTAGR